MLWQKSNSGGSNKSGGRIVSSDTISSSELVNGRAKQKAFGRSSDSSLVRFIIQYFHQQTLTLANSLLQFLIMEAFQMSKMHLTSFAPARPQ
jgi:hypothetical protein